MEEEGLCLPVITLMYVLTGFRTDVAENCLKIKSWQHQDPLLRLRMQ
jgi:hypothetical protein